MEHAIAALCDDRTEPDSHGLIGRSPAIEGIRRLVSRIGRSDAPVLLTGPTGSGKDVVACALHAVSLRARGPFIAVNCAAVPRDLLESEFFGHERGAFTGAVAGRPGMFELAAGGTLFLDEVGDMPLDLQAKLLRALEDGNVRRLGGIRPIRTDVRVLAASNQDLPTLMTTQRFRPDLYYRLEALIIALPALTERRMDIPDLVRHFADQIDPSRALTFTNAALEVLAAQDWPGNIRQLRNFVLRASVLHPGERIDGSVALALMTEACSAPATIAGPTLDLRGLLAGTEIELIEAALRSSDYVVSVAARALNMSRTTLVERIRKHRIELHEDMLIYAYQ